MGRKKNYKLKTQSDESDEPARAGRGKTKESTMIDSSPRKSTSGMWKVTKVTASEPEAEKEPSEGEKSLDQKSSAPVMTTTEAVSSSPPAVVESTNGTGNKCEKTPSDTRHKKTDVTPERSTFQHEKTEDSRRRKRNYRETNKKDEDSAELKRSKISESDGKQYERSGSEGRNRSDRDRTQHKNIVKSDVAQEREKPEENGHRKRNDIERNKKDEDSAGLERSKIPERNGREQERSRSEGRNRSDRPQHKDTVKTDTEQDRSTFQHEKTEESGRRKRNDIERNGRECERSRSEGRYRSDRDRTQYHRMRDIGGGQPSSNTRERSFERRRVEIKPQRPKHSFYRLNDREEALVLLKHPTDIALWGKAEVQVIWGSVTVLGYTMTHTSLERWPVYSPSCNCYIKIHTLSSEGSPATALCKNAVEQYVGTSMDKERLKELLVAIEEKSVIVSIKQLEEKYLQFICSISPFQYLFPEVSELDSLEEDPLHNLGVTVNADNGVPPIEISFEMKSVQQEVLTMLEEGQNPVIALCGGKNVGKSTFGRFLINTVLNHRKEVAFLECDVGQTEFTPPACVALNIVRQPLLGPPFTHQRKPERVCFLGAVTPGDDPGRYLRCLKYVYEAYRCLPEKPVLIVNTMGWNKGLGLTFMADTLRMVSPTLVVQNNCWESEGRNYPRLTNAFVHNTPSWWQNPNCDSSNQTDPNYHHRLITLESPVDVRQASDLKWDPVRLRLNIRYEAPDHRNLALLAHFGPMYDPLTFLDTQPPALEALRPYKVPWSLFALHVCHAAVPNSQIMNVLNGNVVALCHVSESDILETASEGLPDFLRESPVCNCLGFGVIRSIDPVEKCFFILTPLCQSDLSKVNCLLKGSLDLPRQIVMAQPAEESGMIPYVGEPMILMGASSISRRRHLQRRRQVAAD